MGTDQIPQSQIAVSSSSSEISSPAKSSSSSSSPYSLQEEILTGLTSSRAAVQEAALLLLRAATRDGGAAVRASLCTPALLAAVRPLLSPPHNPSLHSNAAASFVNLSLHPPNRALIMRSGAGPALVNLLTTSSHEARDNALAALFSLAVEDGNKAAIAAVGALPPLLRLMVKISAPERVRIDATMAVYHLSSVGSNQSKLIKLGAVKTLLRIIEEEEKTGLSLVALMTLCNLAARGEGKAAMMEAGAVAAAVRIMISSELKRDWCVAALYLMSKGSMRFRALAREAAAEEVLTAVVKGKLAVAGEKSKRWRTVEMAKRALRAVAGEGEEDFSILL